jgi:hypothetical protein
MFMRRTRAESSDQTKAVVRGEEVRSERGGVTQGKCYDDVVLRRESVGQTKEAVCGELGGITQGKNYKDALG